MSKTKKQGAVGLWFELDKETNHLLKLQAEKNGRSKRAEALAIVKRDIQQKNANNN
ncbi:TraY domain-containing protein [Aliivibrio fischeri]|uniref:TraY domain-containing protein n=1 Tax=Aliivibrio fischeri TaxID=668 RepID=UPI0009C107A7|nr:TraY domain-containing protein [Aliivibrio fischeri]MBP3155212.1 TraY domain-containing protein [Aliivibrio fischeri]MCE7575596.1 TraY domain-containing protein [Aliivibrio fischeri]MUK41510.1 TraY domain-containing protein [Aliivibrio fischeri]